MALTSISDADFAQTAGTGLAFLDFYADWCGPCQMMLPLVTELSEEYTGRVSFYKMNVDDNTETPAQFGVRGIPNFLILKDGVVIANITGAMPKALLKARIDEAIASIA